MRACGIIVLGGLFFGSIAPAQNAAPAVPSVVMEDQFEQAHDVKQHRGHVVVLIYGDRASANANRTLGEQLHIAFHPTAKGQTPAKARVAPVTPLAGATTSPDVLAIPVASIGKVPGLVRRLIRGQIKSGSPEVPLWLDFEDVMKTQFGLKPGVPNVVILDTQGRYRHYASGAPTQASTQKLVQIIEALRREAVAPAGKK